MPINFQPKRDPPSKPKYFSAQPKRPKLATNQLDFQTMTKPKARPKNPKKVDIL